MSIPHPGKLPILQRRIHPKKLPKALTRVACFAIVSVSSVSLLELALLSCEADKLSISSTILDVVPSICAYDISKEIPIPDEKLNWDAFSEENFAKHEVSGD